MVYSGDTTATEVTLPNFTAGNYTWTVRAES
jgi:hypothetical protein